MLKWLRKIGANVKVTYGVWAACGALVVIGFSAGKKVSEVNSNLTEIKDGQEQSMVISIEALRLARLSIDHDSILLIKIDSNKVIVDKMAQEYVQALKEDSISRDEWIDKMDGMWQYLDNVKKNESQIALQ